MKKLFRISLLALAVIFFQAGDAIAQKYGYVNSQQILAEMPDVKQMEANLEALGSQLQKKGEQMLVTYKQKEENAIREKEKGTLSPVQEETLLKELQTTQGEIMKFEQEMQNKIVEKRNELLGPIYEKINTAIKDVAADQGYSMIFDSQVLLYAEETVNITTEVKSKLGI
ncbi:MAG: OmpH family outer membrane protein [Saprospiraceae bacterium]|nr:OmpH family outer membrane protein [Saprospiraceae bacterium]